VVLTTALPFLTERPLSELDLCELIMRWGATFWSVVDGAAVMTLHGFAAWWAKVRRHRLWAYHVVSYPSSRVVSCALVVCFAVATLR
jgi:hypothetical protein